MIECAVLPQLRPLYQVSLLPFLRKKKERREALGTRLLLLL